MLCEIREISVGNARNAPRNRRNTMNFNRNRKSQPPFSHHNFTTLATKMQEINHVHAANTPQFRHLRTTFSPFSHHILPFSHRIFAANKPCKRLKNTLKPPQPRQNMPQSIMKPPQSHHIFATLATKMQEIKHVQPQIHYIFTVSAPPFHHFSTAFRRFRTTISPQISLANA